MGRPVGEPPSGAWVLGPAAVISGRHALTVAKLLRYQRVDELLGSLKLQPERRDEIDDAIEALMAAGLNWFHADTSGPGSSEVAESEVGVQRTSQVTTAALAVMLDVSQRQAQTIAERIGRKVGNRWLVDRDEAEAELARRMENK